MFRTDEQIEGQSVSEADPDLEDNLQGITEEESSIDVFILNLSLCVSSSPSLKWTWNVAFVEEEKWQRTIATIQRFFSFVAH